MKPCDFKSVEGKVVIITGAASGIGRAMAKVFAANGMKVVIADIQDELGAKVVAEITENGGEAMYIHTDVSNEENVISTIKTVTDKYGKLNVMVNNAALSTPLHPVHENDTKTVERLLSVDYMGTFHGMKHAINAMLATNSKDCSIINVSSAEAKIGTENFAIYASIKAAISQLTHVAGLDYAKHDITVNAVAPGATLTEIFDTIPREQFEITQKNSPNGRFAMPEEMAYMALYLCTDMARYITGAVMHVDAGMTAGKINDIDWENPDPRDLTK